MTKERCILCYGSGYVTPYPYRRKEKCDHQCSRKNFMYRYDEAHKKAIKAERDFFKIKKALEDEK